MVRQENGVFIDLDDDGGTLFNAQITFTPTASGTYWLDARSADDDAGTYTLSAALAGSSPPDNGGDGGDDGGGGGGGGSDDGGGNGDSGGGSDPVPTDDYLGSTGSSGSVAIGGSITGTLETSGDRDWFSVQLTAGQDYTFGVAGSATGSGTLADPFLVLRDSGGAFISQDDDSGSGANARIDYTPDTSGTFWLSVRSFGSNPTGTYVVTATTSGTSIPPDDGDDPSPPPHDDGDDGGSDSPTVTDDFGPSGTNYGTVAVGGNATIEQANDRDWFSVQLTTGIAYTINITGFSSGGGTLPDPFLVLRDSAGTFINQNDDGGTSLDSRLEYTPTTSGTFFIEARSFALGTGTYTVSLAGATGGGGGDDGGGGDVSPINDVTPDNTGTTGNLTVDGPALQRAINFSGDSDWFRVQAVEGETYEINILGTKSGFTLNAIELVIRDSAGNEIQAFEAPAGQDISPFAVTADYTGDYYLQVRSADTGGTGTYQIDVDTFVSVDDVKPDNVNTDGAITVGGSVTGNIDFSTDQDWFKVTFTAGQTYTIRLETSGFDDPLGDPTVEIVLPNGTATGALSLDDAQFNYTASQTGDFFIRVSDNFSSGDTGMYRLTVSSSQSSSASSATSQASAEIASYVPGHDIPESYTVDAVTTPAAHEQALLVFTDSLN